ncbi:MAG: phosphatase PAP2 family protein [Cyclobacteriaceae bacterium]|nr:phosphatase PAP2 family protein [Cyclobacteriaceae bacterium]
MIDSLTNDTPSSYVLSCMRRLFILFIGVLVLGTSGWAQKSPDKYCSICRDHTHAEGHPYRLDFKREVPFIVTSGVILGAGLLADGLNKTTPFTIEELGDLKTSDINALDRRYVNNYSPIDAKTSDYFRTGVTILPILLLSEHHTKEDITSLLVMSAEVMAVTFGVTNGVKNLVARTRPNVYNPIVPLSERTNSRSRKSFFSGHTSHTAAASFFMAKVISDYHPNMNKGTKIVLWSVSAYIPAITGYLRVKAGKHFPTDVMAGYAVGAFTGWLIPHLHSVNRKGFMSKADLQVYPSAAGMQFSFKVGL